ncbi:MAG TPA: DJ-1/PfpI family protein, partial [Puia sp.]|nr:DJ-1/PfpI family protein [Puia sp.]
MKKNNRKQNVARKIQSKHISIFVPAGNCILSSVIGSYKIFTTVNKILHDKNPDNPLPFIVELVGINSETNLYEGAFNIRPHTTIDKVSKTDLVIIPAIFDNIPDEVKRNAKVVPWIIQQYKQGAEIASLCTGAFLVAATGLLNGKKCATHWM